MFWNQSEENIWIVGHRGVKAIRPENTLISFQKAIELGLDGLETDVHMTTDGQLVLHHDDELDRTTDGTGKSRVTASRSCGSWTLGSGSRRSTRGSGSRGWRSCWKWWRTRTFS